MSLVGKRIKLKDGDTLTIFDKVIDRLGKDGPAVDKYVAAYVTGRVSLIAPFQIDSILED